MSAVSGLLGELPDVGMIKRRSGTPDGPDRWLVAVSCYGLEPDQARRLAAEILNAADACDKLMDDGR